MWYNGIMTWLLRSSLHGIVSQNMMLITYTGRKSGKLYSTPVNYWRLHDAEGEYLATSSLRYRNWWRNLRGGTEVTVLLKRNSIAGVAIVYESEEQVIQRLAALFEAYPGVAKYFQVALSADKKPLPSSLANVAQSMVFIAMRLK